MNTMCISKRRAFSVVVLVSFACLSAIAQDYRVLRHFAGGAGDGAQPHGSLIQSGSTLYGMTYLGGSNNLGTVFRMNADGTGFQLMHSFVSASSDGQKPMGSLIQSGSTFYGMTTCDDTSYGGTVFQIQSDGSGFGVLQRFTGSAGKWPYGDLVQSGGLLYGLTAYGGSATGSGWVGHGTLFQMNTNGNVFQLLHTFAGSPGDGGCPHGSLFRAGSILYGVSADGGRGDMGTIFKINADGSGYQLLHHFAGGANDGSWPGLATVISSGSTLYGMTSGGGRSGKGTCYQINTNGAGFRLLHSFAGGGKEGSSPTGALILSGAAFYGMTFEGGSDNLGTIFRINPDGTGFELLHSFSGADGQNPQGALTLLGSTWYGMASGGGSRGQGVIFALDLVPRLSISLDHASFNVSWDAKDAGYTLERADRLTGAWAPVPGVTGNSATLPVTTEQQFFRLAKCIPCGQRLAPEPVR